MDCHARRVASVALLAAVCSASSLLAEKKPEAAKAPPPARSSLVVHVDPKTMTMSLAAGAGTVPLELSPDVLEHLDTSSEGLKSETRNGVTVTDLAGRFQPVWFVVMDAAGTPRPVCVTHLPPDVETAAKAVRAANRSAR
jgi:hypothetical protein